MIQYYLKKKEAASIENPAIRVTSSVSIVATLLYLEKNAL
jgi:hypothetical protein